ncbi:MAG: dihydrofolate reductase [Candidatus Saccharimonadales bacterium]
MIRLIAAIDRSRGIAKDGAMPWKIPDDERYFAQQTKTHGGNVLSGGATFREAYHGKPLPGRNNYILTRRYEKIPRATVVRDLPGLLAEFKDKDLWVAGGAEVFAEVMDLGLADELYLTHIDAEFHCDRFFPEYEGRFRLVEKSQVHEQNGLKFVYARYARPD